MYISPNEAMRLLEITTRQGLHKIVTLNNVEFKSQGAGKPNLYLKSDLEKYKKDNAYNIKTNKPKTLLKKVKKIEETIKKNKVSNKKLKEEVRKDLSLESNDEEQPFSKPTYNDLRNPLNDIGQDEYNRVIEILKENGTYKEQDRGLVLAYAISYQKYIYAIAASAKEDDTTMDQFSNLKIHPYFTVSKDCLSQMIKIAAILGIGVRSRVNLDIKEKKKETIFDILNSKEEFE